MASLKDLAQGRLSGSRRHLSVRDASAVMNSIQILETQRNLLSGSLPDTVRHLQGMMYLDLAHNQLFGTVPEIRAGLVGLHHNRFTGQLSQLFVPSLFRISVGWNHFTGSLAFTTNQLPKLAVVNAQRNQLAGSIPDALADWSRYLVLDIGYNQLSGCFPMAFGTSQKESVLYLEANRLSGPLPDLRSRSGISGWFSPWNLLTGSIPEVADDFTSLAVRENQLQGAIPAAIFSHPQLAQLDVAVNQHQGTIPLSIGGSHMEYVDVSGNQIRGPLPHRLWSGSRKFVFLAGDNLMTGSLAKGLFIHVLAGMNCAGNMLEGSFPQQVPVSREQLVYLDFSGKPDRRLAPLRGPLPVVFARAAQLRMCMAFEQALEGNIPHFASSLQVLSLYGNHLKTMPCMHFDEKVQPVIFLHNNHLSCCLPTCHRTQRQDVVSVCVVGNHLKFPREGAEGLPNWISPMERDGLFWISDVEGRLLLFKFLAAVSCYAAVIVSRRDLGLVKVHRAIVVWHCSRSGACAVRHAGAHLLSCTSRRCIEAGLCLTCLLSWDRYSCPRTFALASACLRETTSTHIVVLLSWWSLICSPCTYWFSRRRASVSAAAGEGAGAAEVLGARRTFTRRVLVWMMWLPLVCLVSSLVVLNLATKSVPGLFKLGRVWLRCVDVSVGVVQGAFNSIVLPKLASAVSINEHAITSVASLLMLVLVPGLVFVYLDGACLRRWLAWWEPCSGRYAAMFDRVLQCPDKGRHQCFVARGMDTYMRVIIARRSDLCSVQKTTTALKCAMTALLKLQDMWLSKFVTSSLVLPAFFLLEGSGQRSIKSISVFVELALVFEFAVLVSCPLLLLAPLLLSASLTIVVKASIAWERRALVEENADNGATAASMMVAKWSSVILHLVVASAALTPAHEL